MAGAGVLGGLSGHMLELLAAPLETRRIYGTLSKEQKAVLRAKKIEGVRTARGWLKLLNPLRAFQYHARLARRFYQWGVRLLLAGTVLGAVALIALGWSLWLPLLLPLPALAVIGVVFGRMTDAWSDFPDNFHRLIIPFLNVLKRNQKRKTQVELRIDFRGKLIDAKEAPDPESRIANFRDAWFSGTTRLTDGTRIKWEMVDKIKTIHKGVKKETDGPNSKRNPRFKCRVKRFMNVKRFNGRNSGSVQECVKFGYTQSDLSKDDRNLYEAVELEVFLGLIEKAHGRLRVEPLRR